MIKLNRILFACVFLTSVFASVAQRSDCGVYGDPVTVMQPDGTRLTLVAKGTESVHYLETAEGYTVLQNAKGVYEYAVHGADGNLTLSGIAAAENMASSKAMGKTAVIAKHLRYSHPQVSLMVQYHQQLESASREFGKAGPNVFPFTGSRKVLVLLVQYPDLPATVPQANFDLLFNQPNYQNTGSFKDYYKRTSFGALDITTDVYGWFMADSNYKYYGKTSSPNYGSATRSLLTRTLAKADSVINYANYDTDNDGYVDAVMVLHAGIGAEESSAPSSGDYIWSFRSTLSSSQTPTRDGKKFSAYAMFPEKRYAGGMYNMVGIGVISHEFGHIIDLPDLYATAFNGGTGPEGVGNFANMAGGPWLNSEKTPCMHDAWSKSALGWLTPVVLTAPGTYTIPKPAADSNFAYRINTSRKNEYFLLENKQLKGQDRYIPAKGLAIWHVDTTKLGRLSQKGNNANNDTSTLGLGLVQADGERDLEYGNNRGDAKDLYPGANNVKNFTPFTNPNSQLNYKVGGVKQASGIYITNITQNPDSSITFKFGASPTASFIASAVTGCVPLTVTFTDQSVFAETYRYSFGDGHGSNQPSPTYTFTAPGSYQVWLTVTDSSNTISDSTMITVSVHPKPTAQFTFTRKDTNTIEFVNTSANADYYQWTFNSFTSGLTTLPETDLKMIQDSGSVPFKLVAFSSAGCTDTFKVDIAILTGPLNTGIAAANEAPLKAMVFPNPSGSDMTVRFESMPHAATVSVLNVPGEVISESVSMGNDIVLQREIFPSAGVYFVRIESGTSSKVLRIVRNQ